MTFPRVRAMIFVAVLFVTAGVVVLTAINKDSQRNPEAAEPCKPGQIRVNIEVPDEDQVTVNVINGSTRIGLADQISGELANRGFNIGTVGTVPEGEEIAGVARATYGPAGVGSAWLIDAYFLDGALEKHFDTTREGADVDLVLGQAFQQLATTTEVNQRIAAMSAPRLPPGTCPGLPWPTPGPTATADPTATVDPTATATATP